MATVYRCDRCSKESAMRSDFKSINLPYVEDWRLDDKSNHDLCFNCLRHIRKEIEPLPKRKETNVSSSNP